MRLPLLLSALAFFACALPLRSQETAVVRAADGFQLPVGPGGSGEGYYIARGYRPNGHLGEDWNGVHGGSTDLGDPVYATAHGIVVFARNYHVGWGNVVILRHAYYEGGELRYVDSLYGHLLDFAVQEGEQVRRGQQIGRIGNNFGMYEAHLHFEMRKNLQIGMFRSSFARDFTNYYTPNEFVAAHRTCPRGGSMVSAPINTFPEVAPPILVGPHVDTPVSGPSSASALARFTRFAPLPPPNLAPPPPPPTPAPTPKIAKIATPAPAPATPAPTPAARVAKEPAPDLTPKKGGKSSAVAAVATPPATPASTKSRKGAKTSDAVAVASPTPTPSPRHAKETATASTPEPTPQKGGGKTSPPRVAAAAPSATPGKARKPAPATLEPGPTIVTRVDVDTITSDPILPPPGPTVVTPIRRAGSGFKVDRYEDLRGRTGY